MTQMETIYQQKGYIDRDHYLSCLSEDTDCPIDVIWALADLLGESEDFDGLVKYANDPHCLKTRSTF